MLYSTTNREFSATGKITAAVIAHVPSSNRLSASVRRVIPVGTPPAGGWWWSLAAGRVPVQNMADRARLRRPVRDRVAGSVRAVCARACVFVRSRVCALCG